MKLFSLLFFGFMMACSQGSSDADYENAPPPPMGEVMYDMVEDNESTGIRQNLTTAQSSREIEQKIIKTAHLDFETQELEKMYQNIMQLASQNKAIVQSDNSGKTYNRFFRQMTLRVPSENFQLVVNGISDGVAYFDRREITQQDVTEEFVDIEARLKAKRELENRYLTLLKQAKNVKEMLEIERELSTIREEIESREGRLKFLQSKVSMSTIHLNFYKTTSETGVTLSYGQKIKNALQGGWDGISVFFLGLLYLWPLFLLAIIAILVVRWLLRRNKKK
jgi:hypothetical protein